MQIMISHDHREAALATAWRTLIADVSDRQLLVWFSSDDRPAGGIGAGEWWSRLFEKVEKSDVLLAIVTKASLNKPWVLWECGMATAQSNTIAVVPVLYDLTMDELSGPFAGFQAYRGDNKNDVNKLLQLLCNWGRLDNLACSQEKVEEALEGYLEAVRAFGQENAFGRLFGAGFHKKDDLLAGRWKTTWFDEQGNVFEEDVFHLFMYDDRVRIVGEGAKGYTYPMEGRLSSDRFLALTYWSEPQISISGVVLLKVAPSGVRMKGQWIGHTTGDFDEDDLVIVRGSVTCTKIEEDGDGPAKNW